MSPLRNRPSQRRYCVHNGSWSPSWRDRDSTTELSSIASPATRERMIFRTGSPGVTYGMRNTTKDARRTAATRAAALLATNCIIRSPALGLVYQGRPRSGSGLGRFSPEHIAGQGVLDVGLQVGADGVDGLLVDEPHV